MPLAEDFARWRDDPMTRRYLQALEAWEGRVIEQWQLDAMNGRWGRADDLFQGLKDMQAQVRCLSRARHMTFDDLQAWLGIDDER